MDRYTNHGVPNGIQVYNKSWLVLVEGVRELFITQAVRGECLCKDISSTHPMCIVQVYNESRLDLVEGGRELIIRRAEPVDGASTRAKLTSSTRPMCRCIMRAGWTWLRGSGS
jgi:hypothetical protein